MSAPPAHVVYPGPAVPPARYFRLYDGRTLGWGGGVWNGVWHHAAGTYPAARVDGIDRGEPVDGQGRKMLGGFVASFLYAFGVPATRMPTAPQYAVLETMTTRGVSEAALAAYTGPARLTLVAIDRAGWVYPLGPTGDSYWHLTAAGLAAVARYKKAWERRKAKWGRTRGRLKGEARPPLTSDPRDA